MQQTILIVDDEPKIVALVGSYLEASGFRFLQAFNGIDALRIFGERNPDCVVLDINMPGMDGLSVSREIRMKSDVPIIFLSARTDETDRVVGLELGADDYITKPFSPRELVARVKAVLRRSAPKLARDAGRIVRGAVELDPLRRTVSIGGRPVELTTVQFDILWLMMRQVGRVWTRLEILEGCMSAAHEGYDRTIDAHVKNIHKALGDDSDKPRYIETVRGVGYRFMEQADEA